jgi:hypothetical protein
MKMPPIVLKLKGEKMFSVALCIFRQTLYRLAAPYPFHLPFSDVAEAQRYSASTVQEMQSRVHICAFCRNVTA